MCINNPLSFATRTDILASFDSLVPLEPVFGWRISNRHGIHRVHAIMSVISHCDVRRCPDRASCPDTRFFLLIFQFIVVYVCVHMCTYVYVCVCYLRLVTPHQGGHSESWTSAASSARFVTGDYRRTSSATAMYANLMWDTLHIRRCTRHAALFCKIHHGQFRISVCLSSLSLQMLALNATTSINSEHYQPLASSTSTHVRSIPMWHSPTHEAVKEPTAEAFQKAALDVIKSP